MNETLENLRRVVGLSSGFSKQSQVDVWTAIVDNCDALCSQTYVQFWNKLKNVKTKTEIKQTIDAMASLKRIAEHLGLFTHRTNWYDNSDNIADDLLQLCNDKLLTEFDEEAFSSISADFPNIVSVAKLFIIQHRLEAILTSG